MGGVQSTSSKGKEITVSVSTQTKIENTQEAQLQKPTSLNKVVFEELKEILILENAKIPAKDELHLVDIGRINQILEGITSFGCGQQQLVQLTEACKARDIKLAFVTGDSIKYGFDSTKYSPENKILYITLPPVPQTENVIAMASLNEITQELEFNVINTGEEILRQNGGKTLEGYIMGHELSHAMSFIMCLEIETGNKILKLLDQRDNYAFLLENLEVDSNEENLKFLEEKLFIGGGQPDDFRNIFGLGKDDKGEEIISEFHYLNELLIDKIRTPYNKCALLPLVGSDKLLEFTELTFQEIIHQQGKQKNSLQEKEYKELVAKIGIKYPTSFIQAKELNTKLETTKLKDKPEARKFLKRLKIQVHPELKGFKAFVQTLIKAVHKYHNGQRVSMEDFMKCAGSQTSTSSSAGNNGFIEQQNVLFQQSEENMPGIQDAIDTANHQIQDVTGDGNCGFYAILQGLSPNMSYNTVEQNSTQWTAAANLRQAIVTTGGAPRLTDMITNPGTQGDRQIGIDDLPSVAQYLSQQENPRGLVVINSVPNEIDSMYSYYDANGTRHAVTSFENALQSVQNPLILLYTPGHWKAITPK